MRNSKKQRQSGALFEWFFRILFGTLLIVCLAGLCKQCRDIQELQEKVGSTNLSIVAADAFLPEGFNAQSAAYQAAVQRYEIEQGHILPDSFEQKETAPEMAVSEAGRCKGAS